MLRKSSSGSWIENKELSERVLSDVIPLYLCIETDISS